MIKAPSKKIISRTVTSIIWDKWDKRGQIQSHVEFSLGDFPFDKAVELISTDGVSTIATNRVDDFHKLFFSVAVFKLFVDVLHIVEVEFSLAFGVKEGEVGSSSFFGEGVALG